jgi:hypothetical protein
MVLGRRAIRQVMGGRTPLILGLGAGVAITSIVVGFAIVDGGSIALLVTASALVAGAVLGARLSSWTIQRVHHKEGLRLPRWYFVVSLLTVAAWLLATGANHRNWFLSTRLAFVGGLLGSGTVIFARQVGGTAPGSVDS